MATNNSDLFIGWIGALDLRDKPRGADDVKSGDTEKTLGIVDTFRLVDLGTDWDSGIDLEGDLDLVNRAVI